MKLVNEHLKDEKLVKHVLAVEAIMRNLAKHLGEDEELWGLAGLIHDLDYQETMNSPELHATKTVEYIQGLVPEDVVNAVKAHNYEYTKVQPQTKLEKALICSDAVLRGDRSTTGGFLFDKPGGITKNFRRPRTIGGKDVLVGTHKRLQRFPRVVHTAVL